MYKLPKRMSDIYGVHSRNVVAPHSYFKMIIIKMIIILLDNMYWRISNASSHLILKATLYIDALISPIFWILRRLNKFPNIIYTFPSWQFLIQLILKSMCFITIPGYPILEPFSFFNSDWYDSFPYHHWGQWDYISTHTTGGVGKLLCDVVDK